MAPSHLSDQCVVLMMPSCVLWQIWWVFCLGVCYGEEEERGGKKLSTSDCIKILPPLSQILSGIYKLYIYQAETEATPRPMSGHQWSVAISSEEGAGSNQSDYVNTFLSRFCQLIGQIGTRSPDKLTPASITSSPTSTTFINQNKGKITRQGAKQN